MNNNESPIWNINQINFEDVHIISQEREFAQVVVIAYYFECCQIFTGKC
jgi:hypothetical protein